MTEMDARGDVVDLVTRRIGVLEYLDGATAEKQTIAESLDISLSTVNRALRELESLGFVARVDEGYTASTTGRAVADLYREFATTLETTVDARQLLSSVPPTAETSHVMIRGGEVLLAEPPTPYRPIERITELVTEAETLRTLWPAVSRPETVDRVTQAVSESGLDAEIVFEASVAEQVFTAHSEAIRGAMASGQLTVYATAGLPYGLGIVHGPETARAFLVAYGPDSEFRGVVINDSAAAVAWAEDVYRRRRETATELPPPDPDDGHYT